MATPRSRCTRQCRIEVFPRSGHYRYDHPGPGRCHPVITVSAGDRRRQDSPLCDRHLPRHVRAVNHRLNGKARRLCLRASEPRMLHRDPGRVHAPTRALISRQDTQAGCQQTRIEPPRRHGAERVGKKEGSRRLGPSMGS